LGDPEKTAKAIDADGWNAYRDLGTIDQDGYGKIVGRLKSWSFAAVKIFRLPEIESSCIGFRKSNGQIVGVPDEKYGEELCACIKLRDGQGSPKMS